MPKNLTSLYGNFIESLEVDNICFSELSARKWTQPEEKAHTLWSVGLDTKTTVRKVGSSRLLATLSFTCQATNPADESDRVFLVKGKLVIEYSFDESASPTREILNVFKEKNVPLNGWPYLREAVSSATGRLGLTPFFLSPLVIS